MTRVTAIAVAFLFAGAALQAQTVPAQLTLAEAQSLAHAHHPALRKARQEQVTASAGTLQSWGQLLPSASASMNFSGGSSTTLTGQDEFGRPVSLEQAVTFQSSSASQGISLSMPVFDGGQRLRTLSAARAQERVVDARLAGEERRVEAAVARAFYQAMRLEAQIALEQRLLASARDHLERTEALMRIAASGHPDVLGARIQVAAAEQAVARAEGDAGKSRLDLLGAIGIDGTPAFRVVGELPAAFDPALLDVERLVAHAQAAAPAVLAATAATAAARSRASATRASRWPRISATAGFSRNMSLRSYDAFLQLNPRNHGLSFGLGGTMPLFTGFQTAAQIAQAAGTEHGAREDERAALQAAAREVRAGLIDLENAYRTLQLSRIRVELERERLGMAEEQYRQGALNFVLLQQFIEQASQAERQALDAEFGFTSALITLEERAATRLER
jgi:outer membrane protein